MCLGTSFQAHFKHKMFQLMTESQQRVPHTLTLTLTSRAHNPPPSFHTHTHAHHRQSVSLKLFLIKTPTLPSVQGGHFKMGRSTPAHSSVVYDDGRRRCRCRCCPDAATWPVYMHSLLHTRTHTWTQARLLLEGI